MIHTFLAFLTLLNNLIFRLKNEPIMFYDLEKYVEMKLSENL